MKRFIIACLLTLSGLPVYGQSSSLTLDEALKLASQNNPKLKAAQAELGISEAEIINAGTRLNPTVMSDSGIAEDTYRIGIEQTLELGGKRRKRIAVARAQQQVTVQEINQALVELRANVRRAYAALYYAQQRQQALEEVRDTTDKLLNVAQKREKAGDVAILDVLQAEIASVNANNELQTASNQLNEARNTLNAILNQPLDTSIVLAPPEAFPQVTTPTPTDDKTLKVTVQQVTLDINALTETALQQRPELRQVQERMNVTDRELRLARANRVPDLSLTAGPDLVVPGGGENQYNMFAIVSMELPVWNFQQGPVRLAKARKNHLELELAATANTICLEVTNATNSFFTQQTRLMHYETEILPKAEDVLEKSRRSFEEGKSDILVPLNAQQAYINTRLGYLQTLVDLQNAISDLEKAIGSGL